MSRRIILARFLVVLLSCWPILHIVASKLDLISPWKFGGYAMYSVPTVRLELSVAKCGTTTALIEFESSSEFEFYRKAFLRDHQSAKLRDTFLAAFVHDDSLSTLSLRLFSITPEIDCLILTVLEESLSRASGRWETKNYTYEIHRRDVPVLNQIGSAAAIARVGETE